MTTRAEALAEQFEQVNATVIAAVEGRDGRAQDVVSKAEGWPVFFTAWHIADGYASVMGLITAVANGQPPPPVTSQMLDTINAGNLAQHGTCTGQEALAALRRHGATAAAAIRRLSEEQLDRAAAVDLFGGVPLSAQQLIEQVLVGHTQQHLASIRAAV